MYTSPFNKNRPLRLVLWPSLVSYLHSEVLQTTAGAYRLKQWLAVITHPGSRTAPPQAGISEYCRETCHGHECAHASRPPMILLSSSSFSGINTRTPAWSGNSARNQIYKPAGEECIIMPCLTITSIAKYAVCPSWSVHVRIPFSILK